MCMLSYSTDVTCQMDNDQHTNQLMPAMYQCQHARMLMRLAATAIHTYQHVCMSTRQYI